MTTRLAALTLVYGSDVFSYDNAVKAETQGVYEIIAGNENNYHASMVKDLGSWLRMIKHSFATMVLYYLDTQQSVVIYHNKKPLETITELNKKAEELRAGKKAAPKKNQSVAPAMPWPTNPPPSIVPAQLGNGMMFMSLQQVINAWDEHIITHAQYEQLTQYFHAQGAAMPAPVAPPMNQQEFNSWLNLEQSATAAAGQF